MNESEFSIGPNSQRKRWSLKEIFLVIGLVSVVALSSFTVVDEFAKDDLDSLFQRALISFAMARTLNGVISAVQGTEVALQPAGVGLTLTPGEILDPINDLVERFSWIMLGATISLGIQQVMLDVGQWWGLRALLLALSLAWLAVRILRVRKSPAHPGTLEVFLVYALIASLFIRFAVPIALIANEAVYKVFLESRFLSSTQELELAGQAIEGIESGKGMNSDPNGSAPGNAGQSIFGKAFEGARKTLDFEQKLKDIKNRTGNMIEHLIQLSVVFILQTGILPLLFLWIFVALFRIILRFRLLQHPVVR